MHIDPPGLDFIYIVDSNAVIDQGHAGVITGPVDGRWRYDSFGKNKEGHRFGQYYFESEETAIEFARDRGYTEYERWKTTADQDAAAQREADKWHTGNGENYKPNVKYAIFGDNCQNMVNSMAEAADLDTYIGRRHPNWNYDQNRGGADALGPIR